MYDKEITEDDILLNVDSTQFEITLKECGLNIDNFMINKRQVARHDIEMLNKVLQQCKKYKNIDIATCLIELENKIPFKKILSFLNESTLNMLKQEMKKKHSLVIGGNSLLDFFRKE
jgi:hypothetical protein